jgi:ribose-phosphate pyrophosphokinase
MVRHRYNRILEWRTFKKRGHLLELTIFSGRSNPRLAEAIAGRLGLPLGSCRIERFPDGELHVRMEQSVRGHDVYLVQSTSSPAERHLLELLMMADASRRAGASRVTAVMPYFGYARQDRRSGGREPVGARLIVDLLTASSIGRVVTVDLHSDGTFDELIVHR